MFTREKRQTHLAKKKFKITFCSRSCRGKFCRDRQLHGETPEMKDAISANIVFEFIRYSNDNAEETSTKGSVETVRILPEKAKTQSRPQPVLGSRNRQW